MRSIQTSVNIGKNVFFEKDTIIENNVTIGNNVTFYKKVTVKSGTTIFDGAVIGRPPKATSTITRKIDLSLNSLVIGKNSIIGANAVLYTGIKVGNNVLIGDLATIREGCELSDNCVIGRGVIIMYNTSVGTRSRVIDGAILTGQMTIEEDVFIGPGVNTINDNAPIYLSRFGLSSLKVKGPIIRRFALIGAGANLNADVEIGVGAIVAPNAMVTRNVNPWTLVQGVPAKYVREVDPLHKKLILKKFDL